MLAVSLTSAGGGTKPPDSHLSAFTSQSHTVNMASEAPPTNSSPPAPGAQLFFGMQYKIHSCDASSCLFLRHYLLIYLFCFGGGLLSGRHPTRSANSSLFPAALLLSNSSPRCVYVQCKRGSVTVLATSVTSCIHPIVLFACWCITFFASLGRNHKSNQDSEGGAQ